MRYAALAVLFLAVSFSLAPGENIPAEIDKSSVERPLDSCAVSSSDFQYFQIWTIEKVYEDRMSDVVMRVVKVCNTSVTIRRDGKNITSVKFTGRLNGEEWERAVILASCQGERDSWAGEITYRKSIVDRKLRRPRCVLPGGQ